MNLLNLFIITFLSTVSIMPGKSTNNKKSLNPELASYIDAVKNDFSQIPQQRKEALDKIALFIQKQADAGQPVLLTYICTHNSRRSHFGQIWAATAAFYYGIPNVKTYSGGTEATAFNDRAVAACERAGFDITKTTEGKNPVYAVKYAADAEPVKAFSKKYEDNGNPQRNFCAIMTCSQADKACPAVKGATARIAIPYDDPKEFDGTSQEAAKYDERCKQIATETFYVFSKVKI